MGSVVTFSSVHLCHVLLCHLCTCVHFRRALESQAKRCFHICHHIGSHRLSTTHSTHIDSGAELLLLSSIHDPQLVRTAQQRKTLAGFRQRTEKEHLLATEWSISFQFHCGAMATSAVSSVFYLHDAAGNHAETRTGGHVKYGDAASFHEWEFRTRLRIAGKSGDQHIEPMSKVCDGLRGDAFVAAHDVGFDNLCEIVDGRPCAIDTLIQHMRGTFFP